MIAKIMEAGPAAKNLCTAGLRNNHKRLHTDLMIRAHALEKGMSIGNIRYGFGKPKAIALLKDLELYIDLGGDLDFVSDCCSIIDKYLKYNKNNGAEMEAVEVPYKSFIKRHNVSINDNCGIYQLSLDEIQKLSGTSFDLFSQSRYSNRDMGTAPIDRANVEKALKLCERTPTACNRQSQRIHIYYDRELINKLCELQVGSRGFYDIFQGVALICSDWRMYGFQEMNQAFVDGGLYAMNLLYSLNYYGIATIPLTMAHKAHHVQKILKKMSISNNEIPILIIGFGSYKENWKVAVSHRNDWYTYTTFDK